MNQRIIVSPSQRESDESVKVKPKEKIQTATAFIPSIHSFINLIAFLSYINLSQVSLFQSFKISLFFHLNDYFF